MSRQWNYLKRRLKQLQNGNASGTDNLPIDILNTDSIQVIQMLHKLLNRIQNDEEIPKERNKGVILKTIKKGDFRHSPALNALLLTTIDQQAPKWQQSINICFIGLEKDFDRINESNVEDFEVINQNQTRTCRGNYGRNKYT